MSGEFILKACKSFRRLVDIKNWKKKKKQMTTIIQYIYCFVSIFLFFLFFLELKLILFYYWVVYDYTQIFLILLQWTTALMDETSPMVEVVVVGPMNSSR